MTQRQVTHDFPLPACAAGHAARHILDLRGSHAGGGNFIECQCRHTVRHADFDGALQDWCRMNQVRRPSTAKARTSVLQFRLPLHGRGVG